LLSGEKCSPYRTPMTLLRTTISFLLPVITEYCIKPRDSEIPEVRYGVRIKLKLIRIYIYIR
jgi:hypothetical protein